MSERRILEKIKHPFLIKMHWAFQSVYNLQITNHIESLPTFCP